MLDIRPIQLLAGFEPSTDNTSQVTQHFVDGDKIRFRDGLPEKIGGWDIFDTIGDFISGTPRGMFSYILSNRARLLIGTSSRLMYLDGSTLFNMTPLVVATTAIANSLDSYYKTLANDPIATTSGTNVLTITDTATKVRVGDTITLSGASTTNGVPDTEINATHFVRTQTTNAFTIQVATSASSTGSGGGASVVLATGIITVNATAHGMLDGDRVKITDAATFAGLADTEINKEFVIRNVTTSTFDIEVDDQATSSVSGGGGASTKYQPQIPAGNEDALVGEGYGMGEYGVGEYGVSGTSSSGAELPRLWAFDTFGDLVVMTPGNQTGLYSWDSDTSIAPALVTNAPTAINYAFVSDNICVTMGAADVSNRLQWCDQGNLTTWTATSTNQAGQDDIEGASRFLSQVKSRGINLLFTETQVYTFRYIGRPLVWKTELLSNTVGIIGQNARVEQNGVVYWMGADNFYMWRGGGVEVIPSNSKPESTIKRYVFDDINTEQASKIFAWFNQKFNEVWFHYPSQASNDPDMVARYNVQDNSWVYDTMDRTAAEYPIALTVFPRAIDLDGNIYRHENGNDDDDAALAFSLVTKYFNSGTNTLDIGGVIPDSTMSGTISLAVNLKKYAQSTDIVQKTGYSITATTERVPFFANGRFWQYEISGDELGQYWRAGLWQEEYQGSTRR